MITTFLALTMLGLALLWALRILYSAQNATADDTLILSTTIAAWLLIFLGLSALFSPVGTLVAMIICGMVVAKYRDSERRALLWTLAVSADKGLPLAPAARAFAMRRSDEMGRRALLLADLLDAGVSLPEALRRSRNPLPTDAWLAARLGTDTNSLGTALREAAQQGDRFGKAWKPIIEGSLYLTIVALIGLNVILFLATWIFPTLRAIFQDFGTEMPAITMVTLAAAEFCARHWYLAIPFIAYLLAMLFVSVVYYVQGKVWQPPLLSKILGRFDGPYLLRALALCVDQKMPIDEALQRVAKSYPREAVRTRLKQVANDARAGGDWCESLQRQKLIRAADAAVLRSAARVGNLDWALREMGESAARRIAYRARALFNIAMPLVLVLLGIVVALVVFACFVPLVSLITNLT